MQLNRYIADFKSHDRSRGANRAIVASIDSTNLMARRVALGFIEAGKLPPALAIMALAQTAGRGRFERSWSSPEGGIYASILTPIDDRRQLWKLPMAAAVALCAEIDRVVTSPCRLKWPNDLIVMNRKLGGILIESVSRGRLLAAVIGFGVNYCENAEWLPRTATSIQAVAGRPPELGALAARLVGALERGLIDLHDSEALVGEFSRWSLHQRGDVLACRTADGVQHGEFVGFDAKGFLRLETAEGEKRISAGDLIEESGAVR